MKLQQMRGKVENAAVTLDADLRSPESMLKARRIS